MHYSALGKSGPIVPRLAFGAGMTLFDTSGACVGGQSELLLA